MSAFRRFDKVRRTVVLAAIVLTLTVIATLATSAEENADTCQLELAASPPAVRMRYDPFEASPATASLSVHIKNTGAGECDAAIALFRAGPPLAKSGGISGIDGLRYDMTDARGDTLIAQGVDPPARLNPGLTPLTVRVAPGASASLNIAVAVARGQVVAPDEYIDSLDIGLYRALRQNYERVGGGSRLNLAIAALPVMQLSLAGGGRKTTLNFGELAEGATRSLNLQAYANQGFKLHVSSEHGGRMMPLDPTALAEGGWQIPYTIAVNRGGHLTLGAETAIDIAPTATGLSGVAIPVEIKIGNIGRQRAGLYRDVITIIMTPKS